METPSEPAEILNDAENWSPTYESATWPTASVLSPLMFALLLSASGSLSVLRAGQENKSAIILESNAPWSASATTFYDRSFDATVQSTLDDVLDESSITDSETVSASEAIGDALQGLSLAALANVAFPESRHMEPWEKNATDSFFLSHFK